jgi:hypothetical protein
MIAGSSQQGWFDWRGRWLVAMLSCLLMAVAASSLRADIAPGAPDEVRVVLDVGFSETPILSGVERKASSGAWSSDGTGNGPDLDLHSGELADRIAEPARHNDRSSPFDGPGPAAYAGAHGARAPPLPA